MKSKMADKAYKGMEPMHKMMGGKMMPDAEMQKMAGGKMPLKAMPKGMPKGGKMPVKKGK